MYNNISDKHLEFSNNYLNSAELLNNPHYPSKRNVFFSFFNLLRSYVGIGVMSLPYSVAIVGPLWAVILYIYIAFVIILCTHLVLEVADHS